MRKRKINELIIHCTATEYVIPVTVDDVRRWHIERGFDDIGYHYLIDRQGNIHVGRELSLPGAHCKGHNQHSVGICYVGGLKDGLPADTRSFPQKESLNNLIAKLCETYPITKISGHNQYSNKSCPCFPVDEYKRHIKQLL